MKFHLKICFNFKLKKNAITSFIDFDNRVDGNTIFSTSDFLGKFMTVINYSRQSFNWHYKSKFF